MNENLEFWIDYKGFWFPPKQFELTGRWSIQPPTALYIQVKFKLPWLTRRRNDIDEVIWLHSNHFFEVIDCNKGKTDAERLGFLSYISFFETTLHDRAV